jgi:UDP-N-acetylmuramate dehydrogenase
MPSLSEYTSLRIGGPARHLIEVNSTKQLIEALKSIDASKPWIVLGYGTNTYFDSEGYDGTVIVWRGGNITLQENTIIADGGVWWDDVVLRAVDQKLWGIELMSGIPGGVGGAVAGNVAAYGQSIASTCEWVDVFDMKKKSEQRLTTEECAFTYRSSIFGSSRHRVILRVGLGLSKQRTQELSYQWALDYATKHSLTPSTLASTREIIMGVRAEAVSLYDYTSRDTQVASAGSFFKNPEVDEQLAEYIMSFEEQGRSPEQIKKMNNTHSGSTRRVSAAQVLLAAGFYRGQQWGNIQLHSSHILKVTNTSGASSEELRTVTQLILHTVQEKLGILLETEVRYVT